MLLNVYNRYNKIFEKGKGTYIYDNEGNEYLDFVSGISVNCLGHASRVIINALTEQSKKIDTYFKSLLQRAPIRAGKKTYTKQCDGESIFYEQWNRSN